MSASRIPLATGLDRSIWAETCDMDDSSTACQSRAPTLIAKTTASTEKPKNPRLRMAAVLLDTAMGERSRVHRGNLWDIE